MVLPSLRKYQQGVGVFKYLKSVPNVLSERVSMFGTLKRIVQAGTLILGKSSHVCLRVIWLWIVHPWLWMVYLWLRMVHPWL